MNIAFFSKDLPSDNPNGVSVQVHRLAQSLCSLDHQVTVFTFSPAPSDARYTTRTLSLNSSGTISRKFAPALQFNAVDTSSFDILHYHGDDYLCPPSKKRIRTFYGTAFKEALHAHTFDRRIYQLLFYFFELLSCTKQGTLVVISDNTRRYLPCITYTIPCAVPLDRFTPSSYKTPHPSILFMGDFNSRKRGNKLINVFSSEILPKFPNARLTVVGPVSCSGPGIDYAGRIDEKMLIALYQKSWLFCMPSSYEGFGVPIIEAMACGTVVVATHNPGSEQLIVSNNNGILCHDHELSTSILSLLDQPELRNRLTSQASLSVLPYDSHEVALRYQHIYDLTQPIKDSHLE